jgi:hypothetical protein
MTQVTSAHLGESLGTDFFSVREQFTDEQWEHFVTVRRFVDEEVVPMLADLTAMQLYCMQIGRLAEAGRLTPTVAGLGGSQARGWAGVRKAGFRCGPGCHSALSNHSFSEKDRNLFQ